MLGDVIRETEGKTTFDAIETLRRTAVRLRRQGRAQDDKLLLDRVRKLQRDQSNLVARAFSYFLHLANIAEDFQHRARSRELLLRDNLPGRGSLGGTFALMREKNINRSTIRKMIEQACVVPVLTAHPTEVQRKSTLDLHHWI